MSKSVPSQLTLSLFDTTALSGGLTLDTACGGTIRFPDDDDDRDEQKTAPAAERVPARDYRLSGDRALAAGWKARAADNIAAIRLMQEIERADRHATEEEQAALAKFTGFGASDLANGLFRRPGEPFRGGWETLGNELERLVTPEQLAGLARATQYAHYTPEYMVRAMWRSVERMGFAGGAVLEPGCGTGLFLALSPEALAPKTAFTAIEMDPTTARISKLLYPNAWVRHEDFTKARLADTYALAIGNPPFSDRTVRSQDSACGKLGLSLHDYFIARAIERLQPGGIAAFVVSRYTMDKIDDTARAYIAGQADLIGAIRMPQKAMFDAAGTDVVVDILFFQKRAEGAEPNDVDWLDLVEVLPAEDGERAIAVNRYFAERPERVLGTHARTTSQYGPIYTCRAADGADVPALLDAVIGTLPRGIHTPVSDAPAVKRPGLPRVQVGTAAEGATVKEGSYLILNDRLAQIVDGEAVSVAVKGGKGTAEEVKTGIFAKHARIIRLLIPIRDHVRAILRAQEANEPWGAHQVKLRVAYGAFQRAFGAINLTVTTTSIDATTGEERETQRRPNLQPFMDDPDCWLVSSIEEYDEEAGTAKQGPIFTERVIHPPVTPVIVTAADALAVTLHETGHVDLDRIAELLGRARAEVIAELGAAVFLDPVRSINESEVWETADGYLSGAVRTKLAIAEAAAALDHRYERNVAALRRVQPVDLKPSEITARLGAPWIPADVVRDFAVEVIGVKTQVFHTVEIASWTVEMAPFEGKAEATSDWGTARRHAGYLLHDALHASTPQIFDTFIEDGSEKRVLNVVETEAAKEKLGKIKQAFERWIWTEAIRTDWLARIYNDKFNNLVPRTFSGAHLQLPGASSMVALREHQLRAVWRVIVSGSTYIAHAVGAGKTMSMIAAIMEQRRLGLAKKPVWVLPGHCLAQAAREFMMLYPNARILVADETNFVKEKRARFLARAATSVWDCIVITHSAFKFIPTPAWFEQDMARQQVASYVDLLQRVQADDRLSIKRIEHAKEVMEAKLEALSSRKDDMLTIAEIGVDQIVVDEAQEFRKLSFATNMSNLKGVDPDGSQRAWDLFVKTRFVETLNPGRALIPASGTPITNTLGEMFTIGRLMAPAMLHARGIHEFDAWASSFGDTRTELELQPSGRYKPVTRFAEFVNVPELIAMFRSFADVVQKDDLRQYLKLPSIMGGKRQIVTAPATAAFRAYQQKLDARIKAIEARTGPPQKGDDILLAVITDGRHAAIDMRLVGCEQGNDPDSKLNALIANAHRIWFETAEAAYVQVDGKPYPLRGAAQMIFSDLGTPAAEETRGFSAYRWIRQELIRLGVPAQQIAFMQDFKKSAAKQRLFNDVNSGRIRFLIGSTQTMGTGVNAQTRLIAEHHLDVPWLPSDIEQREGRIERQGNQNEEIQIYAYATLGSVDATSWGLLERKARFIAAALAGDTSIRRLEDVGATANQFAMAKALASGDPRLMQKAGLDAEIARLRRLRAAHDDDQYAVRREVANAESAIRHSEQRIRELEADIAIRRPTRGEAFTMTVNGRQTAERKTAGAGLLSRIRLLQKTQERGRWTLGELGGFPIKAQGRRVAGSFCDIEVWIERTGYEQDVKLGTDLTPLGLISRLEYCLERFEVELAEFDRHRKDAAARLPAYRKRLDEPFTLADELAAREAEMAELEASLAANDQGARDADMAAAA